MFIEYLALVIAFLFGLVVGHVLFYSAITALMMLFIFEPGILNWRSVIFFLGIGWLITYLLQLQTLLSICSALFVIGVLVENFIRAYQNDGIGE